MVTELRAVTFNLGCGGPHGAERVTAAFDWIAQARDAFDVVFAQEMSQP